jgi:hypothetical protein
MKPLQTHGTITMTSLIVNTVDACHAQLLPEQHGHLLLTNGSQNSHSALH